MAQVEITEDGFTVDAQVLAKAFDLPPADVQRFMREGAITSVCEKGIDEDAGFWRLTFWYDATALRLIVDAEGEVLKQSRFSAPRPQADPPKND